VLNGKRRSMISHKRGGSGTDMKIEIEISDVLQFTISIGRAAIIKCIRRRVSCASYAAFGFRSQ
jgi:hypothetical protein